MKMENKVTVTRLSSYSSPAIRDSLPESLFSLIHAGDKVVIKPNWVMESHKTKKNEWDYVITHPAVITAVLEKVTDRLDQTGEIALMDGPETASSFERIMSRYPVEEWQSIADKKGIPFAIVDLRDHEWLTEKGIVVARKSIPGDPKGKTLFNLQREASEFWGHARSKRGYYGADYDLAETNRAHDGFTNLYSVSRTVIESDVFINLPKLKTHRKAGITSCLKNLVGINTHKNYLPHHSEGGPAEHGDQFPRNNIAARVEGPFVAFLKQNLLRNPLIAEILSLFSGFGKKVFGETGMVVRSGNWYGNDTIWRMILDLNKILLYGNTDGTMREDLPENRKRYIGIVDAIHAGDGFGPLEPDRVEMGYLMCGTNPVAIDWICAELMGFNPLNIPSIGKAFSIKHHKLAEFSQDQIEVHMDGTVYGTASIPPEYIIPFKAALGWTGYLEKDSRAR